MARKIPVEAFEFYVAIGPARNYQTVADKYGVSKRSVVKRATAESWQARLAEIEAKARQAADARPTTSAPARTTASPMRHMAAIVRQTAGAALNARERGRAAPPRRTPRCGSIRPASRTGA